MTMTLCILIFDGAGTTAKSWYLVQRGLVSACHDRTAT